jgi:hypothetical protein
MEIQFCICEGLNQECDKCGGIGYLNKPVSRPIVAFKLSTMPRRSTTGMKNKIISLKKKCARLGNNTKNAILNELNSIDINANDVGTALRDLEIRIEDALNKKRIAALENKTCR